MKKPPKAPPITRAKTLANIRFLQRRHGLTGFDSDYLAKLSDTELQFLEDFARKYYDGHPDQPIEHKKEAHHRRYMAKVADGFKGAIYEIPDTQIDDLDPETLYLLKESLTLKLVKDK